MKKLSLLAILSATLMFFGCNHGPDPRPFILEALQLADDEGENMKICLDGNCRDNTRILIESLSLTNYPTTNSGRFVLQYKDGNELKYIGIENTDWATFLDAYNALTDINAKELAITQFFQQNFDKFGNLKAPDPLTTDLNNPTYFEWNNGGTWEAFSESSESIKDLETLGANIETSRLENLAETLATNYGLSEERANSVAKNISAYKKLTSRRSLTEKERNFFSSELLGVSFKDAQNALASGNSMDLNKLLETAAAKNGTSPEQVSSILNELFL